MKISTPLTTEGLLPDLYGKFAPEEAMIDGHPIVSFPIDIEDAPVNAVSLALTFVDFDAVPVGGFCWIHWLACDIDPSVTHIPENTSAQGIVPMTQGANSDWSPLAGGCKDPRVIHRYAGPYPPDATHLYTLTVYALDCKLDLEEGYFLNEFRHAIHGHVIEKAELEIPSRAF